MLSDNHTIHKEEVIIDGFGTYETRSGKTVTIDTIGDPKYTFNCKGSLHKKTAKRTTYQFNIWAPNGAFCGIGIHQLDIVKKVT